MNSLDEKSLTWNDFSKVEMRIGTILSVEVFKEARKPAYKIRIDFGPLGKLKTSAQLTQLYSTDKLVGKQVIAVVNFPPKQIANMMSECLILGGLCEEEKVVLLHPERKVANGTRMG